MQQVNKNRFNRRRVAILALLILFIAGGVAVGFVSKKNDNPSSSKPYSGQTVNYGPPTEEEKSAADTQKDVNIKDAQNTTPASTANVIIADASQYGNDIEVRAFVSNVLDDGTCAYTFTQGTQSFSKQTTATKDATTTICQRLVVNSNAFDRPGMWKVTVTYTNNAKSINGSASEDVTVK